MSYHVFFGFSSSLSKSLLVPKGTKMSCIAHVEDVEKKLKIPRVKYKDNPIHWELVFQWNTKDINNETLCRTVAEHNDWVRSIYELFAECSGTPPTDEEELKPEDAELFWHGLTMLDVPVDRWTEDYYRERMEHIYEVMRGRDSEGACLDAKHLTTKQAAAVIRLFEQFLDPEDLRLDVPDGRDYLASSSDGGYEWCEKCGKPIHPDDVESCKRRDCPLNAGV